jgi:hypothetical protein
MTPAGQDGQSATPARPAFGYAAGPPIMKAAPMPNNKFTFKEWLAMITAPLIPAFVILALIEIYRFFTGNHRL